MMKSMKSKAIVGAVATLATVTTLTMAPISQAFADEYTDARARAIQGMNNAIKAKAPKSGVTKGGGRSRDAAMGDAINKARGACGGRFQGYWVSNLEWYNRT